MLRFGRVEVTGGFLLLMAWLNYCDTQRLLLLGVCAATAHEIGHWVAIILAGGRVNRLQLSAVGAQMQVVGTMSYGKELLCALAGPAVNLTLGYWAAGAGWLVFAGMNVALGVFNLLPVGVLDGGRAVRCAVSILCRSDDAFRVQRRLDRAIALALIALGLAVSGRGGGITLVIIGGWLLCPFTEKRAEKWWKKGLPMGRETGKMVCIDFNRMDDYSYEPNSGTNPAQGAKACPLHRR